MGFGKKYNCEQDALKKTGPGPDMYDIDKNHSIASVMMSQQSRRSKNYQNSFANTYDKYDKIMYKGME